MVRSLHTTDASTAHVDPTDPATVELQALTGNASATSRAASARSSSSPRCWPGTGPAARSCSPAWTATSPWPSWTLTRPPPEAVTTLTAADLEAFASATATPANAPALCSSSGFAPPRPRLPGSARPPSPSSSPSRSHSSKRSARPSARHPRARQGHRRRRETPPLRATAGRTAQHRHHQPRPDHRRDRPHVERAGSCAQLATETGAVPITKESGKHHTVTFRHAVNRRARQALMTFADNSRHGSDWAATIHDNARARGKLHPASASSPASGCASSGPAGVTEPATTPPPTSPSKINTNQGLI